MTPSSKADIFRKTPKVFLFRFRYPICSSFDYFEILQVCRFPLIADNGPSFNSNEMKDIFMTNRVSSISQ